MSVITQERLRELLDYDAATGLFVWRVNRGRHYCKGKVAGADSGAGYLQITLDFIKYRAHRLAFFYVTGEWPHIQIDHINGRRDDNRFANLRCASNGENRQNLRVACRNNRSGLLGASWNKMALKWQAGIRVDGRCRHLGYFHSAEAAHFAYLDAKRQLHPFGML